MFCKQNWRFASSLQQKLREGRIQKQTQPNSHISFDGVFQISGDVIEIETHVSMEQTIQNKFAKRLAPGHKYT